MNNKIALLTVCALTCACSAAVPETGTTDRNEIDGRELFYSDSLNAYGVYRTYPEPEGVTYTPAPKGYRPVYISAYLRHGSRKITGSAQPDSLRRAFERADREGLLTPLGREVYEKIIAIDDYHRGSVGDLTSVGEEQHRGIAERMYRNYPNVFRSANTQVRLYSTVSQRTMMSMFACNARLLELNPKIRSTRCASASLKYLRRTPDYPRDRPYVSAANTFLKKYYDAKPVMARLFTGEVPALKDTAEFVRLLYDCGNIVDGIDLAGVDYLWDVFTHDEIYVILQAVNYNLYVHSSNSPYLGDYAPAAMIPLVRDFVDKADAALLQEVPGTDLRFGHDSYLTSFSTLLGLNG
ncbi:MAG: hypothetical protein LUD50_00640, partial [Clostridia bacterium]|nr:hypothetical protein [Clostridia bacterium]